MRLSLAHLVSARPQSTTRRGRRALGAAALTAALAVPASTAVANGTRPTAPALSSTARAHGVDQAHGAVPGWMNKHLQAARTTQPVHTNATRISSTMLTTTGTRVSGIDVSAWSGTVNWNAFKAMGVGFTWVKATEGTYYVNSLHDRQAAGASASGILEGSYHFANPSSSSGTAQADYFVAHGGGWTPGTLPGVVDLEWNPYQGDMCYGMTKNQLVNWITDFQLEYLKKANTWPVIYTATAWWNRCIGTSLGSAVISARSPLWLSTLTTTLGSMPANWANQRVWQYGYQSNGTYDMNLFNGSPTMLAAMARAGM